MRHLLLETRSLKAGYMNREVVRAVISTSSGARWSVCSAPTVPARRPR